MVAPALPDLGPEGSLKIQRTAAGSDALAHSFLDNLFFVQGRSRDRATYNDLYMALAHTVRDRLVERWIETVLNYRAQDVRVVCYLSAEFLTGPHLANNLINLGLYDEAEEAMRKLGLDLETLIEQEAEPGLGNGGLGRLASCFMDSLATLDIPAIGYGIRYEYGIFDQEIRDGWQVEATDKWLRLGNPWALERPEDAFEVGLGGHTERLPDEFGHFRVRWIPEKLVRGIPNDTPILGYRTNTANTMRLWSAQAVESFNFSSFNTGDFFAAVHDKVDSENISKILYPNDEQIQGKQLRLEQQFFFVSCSLQHIVKIQKTQDRPLADLHRTFSIQLNDTHPAIAVAELMRLLVDENRMDWDLAWNVTTHTLSYTNHTLMPEALEKWPIPLFGAMLPRHLEIIEEINRRHLDEVRSRFPGDEERVQRLSIIDNSGERYVRMAHLATLGSHAVNGVAALHTELLKIARAPRFLRPYSREIFEQNQRRHATPLDGPCQSPTRSPAYLASRPQLDSRPGKIAQARTLDRRSGTLRTNGATIKHHNKQRLAAFIYQTLGSPSIPIPCSMCSSSACMSTSASTCKCCTFSRFTSASSTTLTFECRRALSFLGAKPRPAIAWPS